MTEMGDLRREDAFRSVWAGNKADFGQWLCQPANLAMLNAAMGCRLDIAGASPGEAAMSAIVARDAETDGRVILQAEIGPTSDERLAHLLAQASVRHASTLVWVAPRIEPRHRDVLDWLNRLSDDWFRAFGVEIELWRIQDSPLAPRFSLVRHPPHWPPPSSDAAEMNADARRARCLDFWSRFAQYLAENEFPYGEVPKPRAQNWMPFALGRTGCHLSTVFSVPDVGNGHCEGELRVELVLRYQDAVARFEILRGKRNELGSAVGEYLRWYRRDDMNMCRVYVRRGIDHADDRALWPEFFDWLHRRLLRFHEVFSPAVARF